MGLGRVDLYRLGGLAYIPALHLQKALQGRLLESKGTSNAVLIILQHHPVFTLGLREAEDPAEIERLKRTGAEVVHSDRGGLTTFHGPGQLVAYPILHLEKIRMPLRTFVAMLERVAVHTCRLLGVPAQRSLGDVSHTGAWAGDNKICAIGVHCKRHVTTHGLALNCNVDLEWYKHIVPCGIKDKGVTSLSKELGEVLRVEDAEAPLLASFQSLFNCTFRSVPEAEDEIKDFINKL